MCCVYVCMPVCVYAHGVYECMHACRQVGRSEYICDMLLNELTPSVSFFFLSLSLSLSLSLFLCLYPNVNIYIYISTYIRSFFFYLSI